MAESVRLQPLVRARVATLGEAGRAWQARLPAVLAELAEDVVPGPGSRAPGRQRVVRPRGTHRRRRAGGGQGRAGRPRLRGRGRGPARRGRPGPRPAARVRPGPRGRAPGTPRPEPRRFRAGGRAAARRAGRHARGGLAGARPALDRPPSSRPAAALAAGIVVRRHLARPEERPAVELALAYAAELGTHRPGRPRPRARRPPPGEPAAGRGAPGRRGDRVVLRRPGPLRDRARVRPRGRGPRLLRDPAGRARDGGRTAPVVVPPGRGRRRGRPGPGLGLGLPRPRVTPASTSAPSGRRSWPSRSSGRRPCWRPRRAPDRASNC